MGLVRIRLWLEVGRPAIGGGGGMVSIRVGIRVGVIDR